MAVFPSLGEGPRKAKMARTDDIVEAVTQILGSVTRATVFEHVRRLREEPFGYWPKQTKNIRTSPPVEESHVAGLIGALMSRCTTRQTAERVLQMDFCEVSSGYLQKYIDPQAPYALAEGPLRPLFFDEEWRKSPLSTGRPAAAPLRDFTRDRFYEQGYKLSILDAIRILLIAFRLYPGLVHQIGAGFVLYDPDRNTGRIEFIASAFDPCTGLYLEAHDEAGCSELGLDFMDEKNDFGGGMETTTKIEFPILARIADAIERSSRHARAK